MFFSNVWFWFENATYSGKSQPDTFATSFNCAAKNKAYRKKKKTQREDFCVVEEGEGRVRGSKD